MRKSELTNGTKIFVVKIEQFVSLSVFVTALGNEFYNEISPEFESLLFNCDKQWTAPDNKMFESGLDELLNKHSFFKKLTKKSAEELLKDNLRMYGRDGSIDTTMYEASYERGEAINRCYEIARKWVSKKYPYLVNKN